MREVQLCSSKACAMRQSSCCLPVPLPEQAARSIPQLMHRCTRSKAGNAQQHQMVNSAALTRHASLERHHCCGGQELAAPPAAAKHLYPMGRRSMGRTRRPPRTARKRLCHSGLHKTARWTLSAAGLMCCWPKIAALHANGEELLGVCFNRAGQKGTGENMHLLSGIPCAAGRLVQATR